MINGPGYLSGIGYHCHICHKKVAFGWYGFLGKEDREIEDMVLKMLVFHYDQEHRGWSDESSTFL